MQAALIILDGWGIGEHDRLDAIDAAHTPTFDRLHRTGVSTRLLASGRSVGLPEGQMGNSEVGHLNIGAGRIVLQDYTRITDAIEDGTLVENPVLNEAFDGVLERDGAVHFISLVSDGGVHSDQSHLHALIEFAADTGIDAYTHAITDGRDTAPTAGERFISELETVVEEAGTGEIATVMGRYFSMDRDERWDRTKAAYDAIVKRDCPRTAATPTHAVEIAYERGETDEFIEPICIDGAPSLSDGDAVIWVNFRADRARQLTRMLGNVRPDWDYDVDPPSIEMVTMTEYDETFDFPVLFPPSQPSNVLGEIISDASLTQLRIAETEKYAHVTYFLNGGRELEFEGEDRVIVPSPDVATYDEQPEMSAPAVTDAAIDSIDDTEYGLLVLNYANPDMVGHTGDYRATVEAVEAVDTELGRLVRYLQEHEAHVLVTADHGNADDMGTVDDPHTAHTTNDVPCIYLDPTEETDRLRDDGILADLAPTLLDVLGLDLPMEMTGETLRAHRT